MNGERRPKAPPVELPVKRTPSVAQPDDNGARRVSWTARELIGHRFPAPKYAVPGLLAEGLSLLVGAPKLGKSWLALNVAAAIAAGGRALDTISVERGQVIYLALEDPPRRLQRRLRLVLAGDVAPEGLHFETEWPRLLDGGCDELDAWLQEHPGCRLVIVDVFAKVRGLVAGNVNRYEADYAAMATLKELADRYGVAILVVHHTRKASADDYVDAVSGTHGLAAAADAVLVLERSRGSADAKLKVTGRDVEEAEYAMRFDATAGAWSMLEGPAEEYDLGETRRRILAHLREHGAATPKTIADALALGHETVKKSCQRMAADDQLGTDGEGAYYTLSLPSPLSPGQGQEGREGQLFTENGSHGTGAAVAR
jgi:hypothetical protein